MTGWRLRRRGCLTPSEPWGAGRLVVLCVFKYSVKLSFIKIKLDILAATLISISVAGCSRQWADHCTRSRRGRCRRALEETNDEACMCADEACGHACVHACMCTTEGSASHFRLAGRDHDVRSEPVELRAIRQPVKAGSARGAAAWVWRRQYPVRPATLRREDEDESFEHVCWRRGVICEALSSALSWSCRFRTTCACARHVHERPGACCRPFIVAPVT